MRSVFHSYGMHNLDLIAGRKGVLGIATARHDFLIHFHGDAFAGQGHGLDQFLCRVVGWDVTHTAIDDDFHGCIA